MGIACHGRRRSGRSTSTRSPEGKGGRLTERVPLVGQFERDPARWFGHRWHRLDDGAPVALSRDLQRFDEDAFALELGTVPITMGDVIIRYALHPEADWLGPDGGLCTERTRGVLRRRPVEKLSEVVIGKEGDVLTKRGDDPRSAFGTEAVASLAVRGDPWAEVAVPALRLLPVSAVAAECHVAEGTVKRWRHGTARPEDVGDATWRLARLARDFLSKVSEPGGEPRRDGYTILARFVAAHGQLRERLTGMVAEGIAHMGMRGLARALDIPLQTVEWWARNGPPRQVDRLLVMQRAFHWFAIWTSG